jgi:hypothetical protein
MLVHTGSEKARESGLLMDKGIRISRHPLFEKNIFRENPSLFAPFFHNTPDYMKAKYERRRQSLTRYEETVSWPLISGPGFCGATHPGAGKTFNNLMAGSTLPVYDSDCLYINPTCQIFGISDSPGISTFSRALFEEFDGGSNLSSIAGMEKQVNRLIEKPRPGGDRATLALIGLERARSGKRFKKAFAFIAGDTLLFHGNRLGQTLVRVEGDPHFIGRRTSPIEPVEIDLADDDFFIIASDGITSLRPLNGKVRVEDVLCDHMNPDPFDFVFNVTLSCNRIMQEQKPYGARAWFAGNDDISILMVSPDEWLDVGLTKSSILGGYVWRNDPPMSRRQ